MLLRRISISIRRPEPHTIVDYNTWVSETKENPTHNTSRLDREIKEYLFENIFPLLKERYGFAHELLNDS